MSYRNPQIVQPSRAGEIYAQAIAGFGKQAAGTIQAIGDKKRTEEKAANAEAEVNRQIYNKIDIENAEMQADMTQKIKDFQLRDQLAPILTQAIEGYGDAKIALLTEKNPEMRTFYKKEMQKSYATMMDAKTFTESIQGDVGRYSTIKNGADFGNTVGIAGNEIDTQATNQMFLAAISGKLPNSNISMQLNENGGIDLTAFADGKPIRTINSTKYGQSGNELIFDAPDTITEMQKELDAQIKNDAGGLSSDFISDPEIRRFKTGKDNFQQQINRIDVNGIINKGTDVFKGQAAAFDAMSNQRKAFVWRNQLKQNTGYEGALNATPEQIAQAYKDVARTELLKEAKIDSAEINGETVYFQGSKPQLVKPEKIDKPNDTKKLTATERKAKLAEDRAVSLVKKLDEEGVQTFIKSISAGTQFKQLGDVVTLLNVDTDGKITPGTSYNLGTKSGKESFLNDFAKAKYGSGADFDLIQDYIGKKIETAAKEVEYASVNAGPIDYSQFLIKE